MCDSMLLSVLCIGSFVLAWDNFSQGLSSLVVLGVFPREIARLATLQLLVFSLLVFNNRSNNPHRRTVMGRWFLYTLIVVFSPPPSLAAHLALRAIGDVCKRPAFFFAVGGHFRIKFRQ